MVNKEQIVCRIKEQLEYGNDRFVICPAGEVGLYTKKILNDELGIMEIALADSALCKKKDNVISLDELYKVEGWFVVLLATSKSNVFHEIAEELKTLERPIVAVGSIVGDDHGVSRTYFDFKCKPMMIEEIDDAKKQILFARTANQWRILGEQDPYWSVITEDMFHNEKIDKRAIQQFYNSGKENLREILATLIRNKRIYSEHEAGSLDITEIGCGCGRVTKHLCKAFRHVYAYDISLGNINLARKAIDSNNLDISIITSVEEYNDLPQSDVVYSTLVLQHNPPPIIKHVLERMLKMLRCEGIGIFQIPCYASDYCFAFDDAIKDNSSMDMHVLPQQDVFDIIKKTGCQVMECYQDQDTGVNSRYLSSTYVVRKDN